MSVYVVNLTKTYRVESKNQEDAIEKGLDLLHNDLQNKSVSVDDFAIEAEVMPKLLREVGL
jgi:hypothetical protein